MLIGKIDEENRVIQNNFRVNNLRMNNFLNNESKHAYKTEDKVTKGGGIYKWTILWEWTKYKLEKNEHVVEDDEKIRNITLILEALKDFNKGKDKNPVELLRSMEDEILDSLFNLLGKI